MSRSQREALEAADLTKRDEKLVADLKRHGWPDEAAILRYLMHPSARKDRDNE